MYTIENLVNECYEVSFEETQEVYDLLNVSMPPDVMLSLLSKVVDLTNKNIELEERIKELEK